MRIAVFGFYNKTNVGDMRIYHSIVRMLSGHDCVFMLHHDPVPVRFLKSFDHVLIGGGGLVMDRIGVWHQPRKWARKIKTPVGVIGLGVNRFDHELLKPDVLDLVELSRFFYVRDQVSKDMLDGHDKIRVEPDLTWGASYASLLPEVEAGFGASRDQDRIALNLAPIPWLPEYSAEDWVKHLPEDLAIDPMPFYYPRDSKLLESFFPGRVPVEFSLLPLIRAKLLIGCRYHSLIFAMQMRLPVIAIAYDVKVSRLMQEAGLEDFCLGVDQSDRLPECIRRIRDERPRIVEQIDRFASQQETRGAEVFREIRAAVES